MFRQRFLALFLAVAAQVTCTFGIASGQIDFGGTIGAIDVVGNQRFSDQAVIAQSGLSVGQAFDPFLINEGVKALFATGNFQDVDVSRRSNTLVLSVDETQFINRIFFEGNSLIDDSDLDQLVSLAPADPLSRSQLQQDVNTILGAYASQSRFQAQVRPTIVPQPSGSVDIVFNIAEGGASRVGSVNFVGNQSFTDRRLRGVVESKQAAPIRSIFAGDRYSEGALRADEQILSRFYQERGFADFEVTSAQGALASDQSGFVITFGLNEGPRYRISNIIIESQIPGLDGDDLRRSVGYRRGTRYEASKVAAGNEEVRARAERLGFGAAVVETDFVKRPSEGTLDVVYRVTEGPRISIERIEIQGNLRTRDYVIRREMRLAEGDAFSRNGLQRSLQRIQNLGYFSNATIQTRTGSSGDQAVVVLNVEEQSTGSINLGGGLNSGAGASFNFSFQENNLLGRGQRLAISASLSENTRSLSANFTEPWFLGREVSAGIGTFYNAIDSSDASTFSFTEYGLSLNMGYKLSERLTQNWSYTIKQTEVSDANALSIAVLDQIGTTTRSILGHSLVYNRLDSNFQPTGGYRLRLNNELAGNGIGGDVDYFKTTADVDYFTSLGGEFTLYLSASGGQMASLSDDPVPLVDRFSLGDDLVRGFAPAGLGPRAGITSIGATSYYGATAEVQFPFPGLAENGVSARLFYDVGTAYDEGSDYSLNFGGGSTSVSDSDALRSAYGVGITWISPLGPLRFDYGIPVDSQPFDTERRLSFGFSTGL